MSDDIRAIVVDPTKRTVEEVLLATEPGEEGAGTQVNTSEFQRVLGCKRLEGTYLGPDIWLILDGEPVCESGPYDFWQYGEDCEPIPGVGVISGHDMMREHSFDCPISIEDARSKIIFTKRIIRGDKVTRRRRDQCTSVATC